MKNSSAYLGHGKSGGVQLHSMSDDFQQFGLIFVWQGGIWHAEVNGVEIAHNAYYGACRLIAISSLISKGNLS